MKKIAKLTADEFAKKIKMLDIGESFYFAASTISSEPPQTEADLCEWYGVQKICLFDKDMYIISICEGSLCEVIPADDNLVETEAVQDFFDITLCVDSVYVVDEKILREKSVSLTPDYFVDARGYTNCGENVLIPPSEVHRLVWEIDERDVKKDVEDKIEESELPLDFSDEEISEMAGEIIDRRDDCDLIYEIYWEIVRNVIDDFSKRKNKAAKQ